MEETGNKWAEKATPELCLGLLLSFAVNVFVSQNVGFFAAGLINGLFVGFFIVGLLLGFFRFSFFIVGVGFIFIFTLSLSSSSVFFGRGLGAGLLVTLIIGLLIWLCKIIKNRNK